MTLLHLLKLYPNEETTSVGDTLVSEHYDELVRKQLSIKSVAYSHPLGAKMFVSPSAEVKKILKAPPVFLPTPAPNYGRDCAELLRAAKGFAHLILVWPQIKSRRSASLI